MNRSITLLGCSTVIALALAGCGSDPVLTNVLGESWNEAPVARDGEEYWRSYVLEPNEVVATQHCGDRQAEVRVPVRHEYVLNVLEDVRKTTTAGGLSCIFTSAAGAYGFDLALDGQNLLYPGGALIPYGPVSGSFGPRSFRDIDDDATIKFFITPTVIDAVAECDNGINASANVPVEIEHYFVAAQDAMASDGDCRMELQAGNYRYYPEGDELLLEYEGGPQVVLMR